MESSATTQSLRRTKTVQYFGGAGFVEYLLKS